MLTNSPPELRNLFEIAVTFEETVSVGDVPLGTRRILIVRYGSFSGNDLDGNVLAGGGDWVLHRSDGVAELDIRLTLRTNGGETLYMMSRGIFAAPTDVAEQSRVGQIAEQTAHYFRTVTMFETASARHQRLNRIVAVGVGTRLPHGMKTKVFEVT